MPGCTRESHLDCEDPSENKANEDRNKSVSVVLIWSQKTSNALLLRSALM